MLVGEAGDLVQKQMSVGKCLTLPVRLFVRVDLLKGFDLRTYKSNPFKQSEPLLIVAFEIDSHIDASY
jgi:hypothetical protein